VFVFQTLGATNFDSHEVGDQIIVQTICKFGKTIVRSCVL